MGAYSAVYRAKAVSATATEVKAFVPQVFGDTEITITDFLRAPSPGMGWVSFQGGNPEFPVWLGTPVTVNSGPIDWDSLYATFLNSAGDTLTGPLLGVTPTADAHLTRKDYVDARDALKLNLTGGALTGALSGTTAAFTGTVSGAAATFTGTVSGALATAAGHLVRKDQMDAAISAVATGSSESWVTARQLALAGDASGSVMVKGDQNMTLTVTVLDDSHTHDLRYYTEAEIDALLAGINTSVSGRQPLDADLTTIAALTATTDNVIQSVAGAWASRTPAQLKTTLALTKVDVGLANVDNTSDVNKPVSTAQQTALNLKLNLTGGTLTGLLTISSGGLSITADSLGFASRLGQHVNLYGTTYGFGIQSSTLYSRGTQFAWYSGGSHNDGLYNSGGGTELLRLSTLEFQYKTNTVWHAGNDGAGSTLDADLLDGQHGAYYSNAVNLTGTIPSARLSGAYTGITALEDITFTFTPKVGTNNIYHQGNDGPGSGLDADLLDGLNGDYFAPVELLESILGDLLFVGLYDAEAYTSAYIRFPGTMGNYLQVPSLSLPANGPLTVVFKIRPDAWPRWASANVLYKWQTDDLLERISGFNTSNYWGVQYSDGAMSGRNRPPATGRYPGQAMAALPDGLLWGAITYAPDGGGGRIIRAWTTTDGTTWAEGDSNLIAAAPLILTGTSPVTLMGSATVSGIAGALDYISIRSDIGVGGLPGTTQVFEVTGYDTNSADASFIVASTGQTVNIYRSGTRSTALVHTKPMPIWGGGSGVYRHGMYWIVSQGGELDFIDADLSGRYEVATDQPVLVHNGDWIIAIDPQVLVGQSGVGEDRTLSQMTFQYIPFSTETYVKSQIELHLDQIETPDPHSQYHNDFRGDQRYSPLVHSHDQDFEELLSEHVKQYDFQVYSWSWENGVVSLVVAENNVVTGSYFDLSSVHPELDGKHQGVVTSTGVIQFEALQPSDYPTPGTVIAVSAVARNDPHGYYLTETEADLLYADIAHRHDALYEPIGTVADHEAKDDPHPQYVTADEATDLPFAPLDHNHDGLYLKPADLPPPEYEVRATDLAQSAKIWIGDVEPTAAGGLGIGDLWVDAVNIALTAPAVATNFVVTSITPTSVGLSWTAWPTSTAQTSVLVERATNSGFSTGLTTVLSDTSSPYDTTVTATGLVENTTYWFRVRAANAQGNGPYATLSVATTNAAPGVPTGLNVTSITSTSMRLNWTAPSGTLHATQPYEVFKNGVSQGYVTTLFKDFTGLTQNTAYTLGVRAKDPQGAVSTTASTTGTAANAAPPAPTGLALVSRTYNSITVDWNAVTGISDFKYYTSQINSASTANTTGTSRTFTGLAASTPYTMRVRTEDDYGAVSAWSGEITYSTLANPDTTPPSLPTLTSFKPESSYGRMVARFTCPSNADFNSYRIDRSTNATTWIIDRNWTAASPGAVIGYALNGGTAFAAGTRVYCRVYVKDDLGNYTYATFSSYLLLASPAFVTATGTNTWKNVNGGQYNFDNNWRPYQGYVSDSKFNAIGLWYYGTKPYDELYYSGRRTITSASMKFKREGCGSSAAMSPVIVMHNQTTSPGAVAGIAAPAMYGTPYSVGGSLTTPAVGGDAVYYNIPSSWAQDLVEGSHRGIAVYNPSAGPYACYSSTSEYSTSGTIAFYHLG